MIIVIGIAGSGKSTQCQILEDAGGYKWLSVGQLLRKSITDPNGKSIINNGDILDDDIVIPLVSAEILSYSLDERKKLLLDGFPRTLRQCRWLLADKEKLRSNVDAIIHIDISKKIAQQRLLSRGRSDDYEIAIKERFSEYECMILPILEYFRTRNVPIVEINGDNPPSEVHKTILSHINGVIC